MKCCAMTLICRSRDWVKINIYKNDDRNILTVPTRDFLPSCSQPKSPTMNFMISYHFYGSKEGLCKIFSNFVFGKGLIFALKVWDCSKKQE